MIKGRTLRAGNCYFVKIRMCVTKSVFAALLTDKYYGMNSDFPDKLSKTEARKIIDIEMFFHGIKGRYHDSDESLGSDNIEAYNAIFTKALTWVIEAYPYLNQN